MHDQDFRDIVTTQMEQCAEILLAKSEEYSSDVDRLHNFKVAAELESGGTPRTALAGMMRKHTVSVYDMIYSGKTYSVDQWDEKITDHINYLLLLKAVIVEESFPDETVELDGQPLNPHFEFQIGPA